MIVFTTVLMVAILILITLVYMSTRTYGDEKKFFVLGDGKPALFAMLVSIAGIFAAKSLLFVLPFVAAMIWFYFIVSPIVSINGDKIEIATPEVHVITSREWVEFSLSSERLLVKQGEREFCIKRNSLNFDRLLVWLHL